MQNQPTEPSVDFDFDQVYRDLDGETQEQLSTDALKHLAIAIRAIIGWIAGDLQHVNPEGMKERAAILAWHSMPELGNLNQTELAKLFGLNHRQSIHRHVTDFKQRFPGVLIAMRRDGANATEQMEVEPE